MLVWSFPQKFDSAKFNILCKVNLLTSATTVEEPKTLLPCLVEGNDDSF